MSTDTYLLDNSSPDAGTRFAALSALFDEATMRHVDALGVRAGWRCWEVGAGGPGLPGLLAERVGPTGHVLATDLDVGWMGGDLPGTVEVRRHDVAADDVPGPGFDLVHARLVLTHVPERHEALRRMVAALAPGGWLLIEDFDVRIQPLACLDASSDAEHRANRVRAGFVEQLARRGVDLTYGRALPRLLRAAGLSEVAADAFAPVALRASAVLEAANVRQVAAALISHAGASAEEVDAHIRAVAAGRPTSRPRPSSPHGVGDRDRGGRRVGHTSNRAGSVGHTSNRVGGVGHSDLPGHGRGRPWHPSSPAQHLRPGRHLPCHQILARLADLGVPAQRITLICIGEHPGIAHFGGLGELTAGQLRDLPATNACARLTPAALELATDAWAALQAPTPDGLPRVLVSVEAASSTARPGQNRRVTDVAGQIPEYLDQVGPGWRDILMRAHAELVAVLPTYQVSQVKEKYGTLRLYLGVYVDPATGEIGITRELGTRVAAIVRAAEEESGRTCEVCGEPGSATDGGWIKTLCPDHARPR